MRAIDTNVLVRLIARDDAAQTALADAFVEKGAWVPLLALAETALVLDAVYARTAEQIATCVDMAKLVAATNVVSGLIGRPPVSRVAAALNAKMRAAK